MRIRLKRVYDPAVRGDGVRILVDRLWPRGLSKDSAALTEWMRDLAPSNELRRWFHAHPVQWPAFRKRYIEELASPAASAALERLHDIAARRATVTLLFASRDVEQNNAVVLKDLLEGERKPPTGTGPVRAVSSGRARAARRG